MQKNTCVPSDLKNLLKKRMREHEYRMWIEPLEIVIDSNESITILAPNKFTQRKIKDKGFTENLKAITLEIIKKDVEIKCEVNNTSQKHLPSQLTGERLKESNKKENGKKIIEFPIWPEQKRACPNVFLRSSLFSCKKFTMRNNQQRKFVKEKIIICMGSIEMRFTGEELDQSDLTLWLQVAHLARFSPVGNVCICTSYSLVKDIKGNHGQYYKWLKDSLKRLRFAGIEIRKKGEEWKTYTLLEELSGHEGRDLIRIKFHKDIINLFLPNNWTAVEWQERKKLRGKGLALWLHGYYYSHTVPYPVKAETIWRSSGATTPLKVFKSNGKKGGMLVNALEDLAKVTGWNINFDGQLVKVDKGALKIEDKKVKGSDVSHYQPSEDIISKAKQAAPRFDVNVLLKHFKNWNSKKETFIDDIDSAFIGFCRKKEQRE